MWAGGSDRLAAVWTGTDEGVLPLTQLYGDEASGLNSDVCPTVSVLKITGSVHCLRSFTTATSNWHGRGAYSAMWGTAISVALLVGAVQAVAPNCSEVSFNQTVSHRKHDSIEPLPSLAHVRQVVCSH